MNITTTKIYIELGNMTDGYTISNYTSSVEQFDLIIHRDGPSGYSLLNYAPYKLWFLILDFIIILPTLFGNILILIALTQYNALRKRKGYILIGNLAVSDLLVGLVFLPMDIALHFVENLLDNGTYCLCYYSVLYTLITASVLNLLLLSVERCHAIIRPFRHASRFTTKRVIILISATWIFVLILGSLPLFGWRSYTVESDTVCRKSFIFTGTYQKIINAILIAALTVCFICFIAVIRIAISKANETKTCNMKDMYVSGSSLKRDINYSKMLLLVSGIFVVCWGPYYILSFIPYSSVTMLYITNLLASLGLVNSCLNWIVYGVRNRKFRATFKDILRCTWWHGKLRINSQSN